jgi:choline kinase
VQHARTVIINAAGRGGRFGGNINKSLVSIKGRKIIEWQLMLIPDSVQLVVGIGYQSELVYETVRSVRPDAIFSVSREYRETGTGYTLCKSAHLSSGLVTSLDGDLLLAPADLSRFVYSDEPLIGIAKRSSKDPVFVDLGVGESTEVVTGFRRREASDSVNNSFEWSGLVTISADFLCKNAGTGHVYEVLEKALPIRTVEVNCAELDYPSDLNVLSDFIGEWYL